MELQDLGYNSAWQNKLKECGKDGCSAARVTAVNRDNYLLRNDSGELAGELAGEFRFSADSGSQLPVVGDWALVQYFNSGTLAIIYGVLPRRTLLRRKTAGKKVDYQMIAANIDTAFIVQGCDFDFNLRRLERYLVMVHDGDIKPVILLSKSDLVSQEELEARVSAVRDAHINCEIIPYSIRGGQGITQIQEALEPAKTYCLLGSSGVGKTTLLNHLIGREAFETNLVREKDGRGRHTTSRRQLVILEQGAMLIDTPGIRELGNIDAGSGIDHIFSDIAELAAACRFNDCTHTGEAGCAVLGAVQNGELDEARYQSYLKLMQESDHYQMSYAEKRRKDRKLGQFFKTAKKEVKQFKKR